jgi:hypothetical protein
MFVCWSFALYPTLLKLICALLFRCLKAWRLHLPRLPLCPSPKGAFPLTFCYYQLPDLSASMRGKSNTPTQAAEV